jgi:hypothetical protein
MACMRLAQLQLQARIETGDQLTIAGSINESAMTDTEIDSNIQMLSKVISANTETAPLPRNLVPKTAGGVRATPSLQAPTGDGPGATIGLGNGFGVRADEIAFE